MKKILITGISGFIGQYLFENRPHNIHLSGTFRSNIPNLDEIKLKHLDLSNPERFIQKDDNFDVVIHAAALSDIGLCERNKAYAAHVNTQATEKLAKWSSDQGSRFIFLSTDNVFRGDKGSYSEYDNPDPINIYGKSKLEAEEAVIRFHPNAVICRIALCLGKGLRGTNNFVDWVVHKLMKKEKVRLFYDELRTPTTPRYIASSIWDLVDSDFKGIIHLTGAEKIDRYSIVIKIAEYLRVNKNLLVKVSLKEGITDYFRPEDVSLLSVHSPGVLNKPLLKISESIDQIL